MSERVMPKCASCGREFAEGESGYVEDWKALDTRGNRATWRIEQRYTCDDCEAKP